MTEYDAHRLATCGPEELGTLVVDFLWTISEEQPKQAADAIAALVSNPHLTFDQFVRVLAVSLGRWLKYQDLFGPSGRLDAEFQIPADAPGERAAEWWHRLSVDRGLLDTAAGSEFRHWTHVWVFRRAFATSTPDQWAALWRAAVEDHESARAVHKELTAFALHRGLPEERQWVMSANESEIKLLCGDWDRFVATLDRPVSAVGSRADAARTMASAVGFDDPLRAGEAASLRAAVLESALAGQVDFGYGAAPQWMALFTADDQASVLSAIGRCRKESVDTWINDVKWRENPRNELFRAALRLLPLDDAVARSHLRCAAPRHRIAMVLNPRCPEQVAIEALRVGIREADVLLTTGRGLPPEGGDALVETLCRVLLRVREWFPAEEVSAAWQTVTGWMLASERRLHWFWPLAVTASQPNHIIGMSPEQYAAYECWLDELAEHAWTRSERSDLKGWRASDFAALTSTNLFRRLVRVTGEMRSPLLTESVAGELLADLGADHRVQIARTASRKAIEELSRDTDKRVRQHVARNRNVSIATLEGLASDSDPSLRSQVARNPRVTAKLLTTLATDADAKVAQAAGRALLARLAAAS